ncbi:hypothetical protein NKJ23_18820 [Mesorhizobium sp. M0184]|uniref:hypothetical protein n=1 Tax=Mesorhizobium sp. M0184 TaxID=2956906 RepID=UPI00333AF4D0
MGFNRHAGHRRRQTLHTWKVAPIQHGVARHAPDRCACYHRIGYARQIDLTNDKQAMCIICSSLPLEILFPIIHPMKLTVANTKIDEIILEIKAKGKTPVPGDHIIEEFTQIYNRMIYAVFLQFYEFHRPHIQSVFGTDTKGWPQIFQFAWLIRNGVAHHGGHLNFTNPNYPPVTWHTYSYSPADNGKPILGAHFTVSDMFAFLFDLSDELDAIGAPMPN